MKLHGTKNLAEHHLDDKLGPRGDGSGKKLLEDKGTTNKQQHSENKRREPTITIKQE